MAKNLVGQKFGRLLVLDRNNSETNKKWKAFWNCKCDCSTENNMVIKIVDSNRLTSGNTTSCGCLRKELNSLNTTEQARIGSARRVFLKHYSDGDLSLNEFMILSQHNCYYCGFSIEVSGNYYNKYINIAKLRNGKRVSNFSIENGLFIYHGLDRVDSNYGHFKFNVIPCCFYYNSFKSNIPFADFSFKVNNLNEQPKIILSKDIYLYNNYSLDEFKKEFTYQGTDRRNKLFDKIRNVKISATKRNIKFNLTKNQCAILAVSTCIYCNHIPDTKNGKYNGIDRIDNNIGYELDNCVSCCKYCNPGKLDKTLDEFIFWINHIKSYQEQSHSIEKLIEEQSLLYKYGARF